MKWITRDDSISVLNMSVRVNNCFNRIKLLTVGDFLDYPEDEFVYIRNIGKTSLEEILRMRKELRENDGNRFRLAEKRELMQEEPVSLPPVSEAEPAPKLLYDLPISEMHLSARAINCLNRVGWTRASQLLGKQLDELLSLKSMGRKTAEEILAAIAALTLVSRSGKPESATPAVNEELLLLADELASVFGGLAGSWVQKLEALPGGGAFDRAQALRELFAEKELRDTQKTAICEYLEAHDDSVPLSEITGYMASWLAEESVTAAWLDELADEREIELGEASVSRLYPSAMDFAESLPNERQREILLSRMSGKTLEEVAASLNLTRERVRQLQNKALAKHPRLREDRYAYVFRTYYFSLEDFRLAFDELDSVYYYLELATGRKQSDSEPLEKALEDETLSVPMRRKIERAVYKQFITVDGVRIPKKRQDLVHYVIRSYCREEVSFDEFLLIYEMFLEDYGLEKDASLLLESRTYENQLNASRNVLWKPGRKLRYYNMEDRDFRELLDALDLGRYTDAALSTLLFFRQLPELMREYDIRDEYELHNLLKKIWGEREPKLVFSRNPSFVIGNGNHADQALELLMQYAPIGYMELAEKYEEAYGMRAESAAGTILRNLNDYYHDGVYSIDAPTPPPGHFSLLQERLTGDFYTISEIQRLYMTECPQANRIYINPYSLKVLGFHVYSDYVVSKRFQNASDYFSKLLTESDITDLGSLRKELFGIGAFESVLAQLRQQYEIIEFEPRRLVHIRRLEAGGVTKDMLREYRDAVLNRIGEGRLFTIRSLRREGFTHDLEDLGFDDWFYSSLLCEDSRFSSRRMGGTRLLYTGEKAITLEDLLTELLLEREKIDVYELADLLRDAYGISFDKDKLTQLVKESSLYYDSIMETVYLDYDTYFEEI